MKNQMSEDYFGEKLPQYIGEYIAEYIEAPKTLTIVVAVTYIISIVVSCVFLNKVIKSHDEEVVKFIAADVYDTIHNELLQSIMVSRTIANDRFLKQNLQNEANISPEAEIALMQNYLGDIKAHFGYNMSYVVSEATKNYYYEGGLRRVIDVANNPYDIWYKNFLDKNVPYDITIDYNEFDKNLWDVFINSRIEDKNGNLLGVCGIGMAMNEFQATLSEKESAHTVKIDLFKADENLYFDTSAVNFKDPYLKELILQLQEKFDFQQNQFILEKIEDIWVVVRYIPEVNSYMIVRRDNSNIEGGFSDLIFQIIVASSCVLLVLVLFVQVNIGREHKKLKDEEQRRGIVSHADKYALMYVIDLKYNSAKQISRTENFNLLQIRDGANAARKIKNAFIATTKYETLRGLLEFINFDDLQQRIKGKRAISYEFLSKEYGWCRANFILLDNYGDKEIDEIVFAIESIDAAKRRAEDLKRRSETDAMTGLKNRGGGEKAIRDLISKGTAGMFCLMDADKFKSINDNYGHDVGDKVIKAIADCLKKTFRKNDVTMRLGGDEFAVFAVGITNEERGQVVIDRLFDEINRIDIPELGDRKITISVGATFFNAEENLTFEEVYKRADLGTYGSKKIQGNFCTFNKND